MSDPKYWLGFNLVKGIGPAAVQALRDYYGDLEAAWRAPVSQLEKIGLDKTARSNLVRAREKLDLDVELKKVEKAGCTLLTLDSKRYPEHLRHVTPPPPVLYVAGEMTDMDAWAVAVVGTRKLTPYGRQVTQKIVAGLVQSGLTIVSGLARGIDGVAHRTAIEAGGRTIAVMGSGLDVVYPSEHRSLARDIVHGQGAVISELPMGTRPEARNFPPRNRIISGLSLGVLVVEAGARSGASITANFALEQGREVLAVPGNINSPASKGTNRLIQDGAKMVTSVEDVLEELNVRMVLEQRTVQAVLPETAEESALYACLSAQPVHIDDISRQAKMPSSLVSSTLTIMELKGMVQQVGGMKYVLVREADEAYEASASS